LPHYYYFVRRGRAMLEIPWTGRGGTDDDDDSLG
jgi:hypothetical protein